MMAAFFYLQHTLNSLFNICLKSKVFLHKSVTKFSILQGCFLYFLILLQKIIICFVFINGQNKSYVNIDTALKKFRCSEPVNLLFSSRQLQACNDLNASCHQHLILEKAQTIVGIIADEYLSFEALLLAIEYTTWLHGRNGYIIERNMFCSVQYLYCKGSLVQLSNS